MTPAEAMAAKLTALQEIAEDSALASCDVRLGVLLLTVYFNVDYGCAWPSRSRLAEQLDVAASTVTRALKRLEARGHFIIQWNKGRGHTNKYFPYFIAEKGASARPISEVSDPIKGSVGAHKRERPRNKTPFMNPLRILLTVGSRRSLRPLTAARGTLPLMIPLPNLLSLQRQHRA